LLTHPMLDQLHQLGLSGMAQAFAELEASGEGATLTHADWLSLLVDREVTHRRDKRLATRLRYARLRHNAVVEDVDYRVHRGLDRALFHKLTAGEWIDAHDNLILCGPTGVGKSWLACALGHKACRDNRSVLYQRVPKLFADLALARGDGRYARIMRSLNGAQLLILDDWGLDRSTPAPAAIFTRFSKNATAVARPSSPARSLSTNGTRSSATRPTPTPSSIASSTTPIASISLATACAAHDQNQPQRIDPQLPSRH
jgi:DNA replication protein DnaC